MTIAAIIGAGDLGGAVAQALASRQAVDRVVLVDSNAAAASGKALDIQQSGAISGFDTKLQGTADVSRAIGCHVCIVADQFAAGSPEVGGATGLQQVTGLARLIDRTPLIFAGASHAALIHAVTRDGAVSRQRAIGSCPEAFISAVRAIVAMEAGCAPGEVMLSVLGCPPHLVVPWSQASIGGYPLEAILSPVQRARVDARAARLWPPQPYALGMAAAMVAQGVVDTGRRAFSVLTLLDGEFGVRGLVGAVPTTLGPGGVLQRRVPPLTTRERVQIDTALGAISR